MSRDAVVTDLVREQTRQLKMPGAARAFESLAREAREEKSSFEDYLHQVLAVEITSRRDSAVRQRLRDARFPETKTLDQFDFAAAWRLLVDQHGPKQAARVFAQVLHAVEQRGQLTVAREVSLALASGEPLQLAVRSQAAVTPPVPLELLPSSLAGIEVLAGVAADYDVLLGGVQ